MFIVIILYGMFIVVIYYNFIWFFYGNFLIMLFMLFWVIERFFKECKIGWFIFVIVYILFLNFYFSYYEVIVIGFYFIY